MNIKGLVMVGVLSISMPIIAFAAECRNDICDDVTNSTSSGIDNSALENSLTKAGQQLILVPVTTVDTNTGTPTFTESKK